MNTVGQIYYLGQFFVFDQNGSKVETLTNADFTSVVYVNGVVHTTAPVTVIHLSAGGYLSSFTPDTFGTWTVFTSQAAYQPNGWTNSNIEVSIAPPYQAGQIYYLGQMFVFDQNGNPVENLTDLDFTKSVYVNGIIHSAAVTVEHLAGGGYMASFVPDVVGTWTIYINQPTYFPLGWTNDNIQVTVAVPVYVPPAPECGFTNWYGWAINSESMLAGISPDDPTMIGAYNEAHDSLKPLERSMKHNTYQLLKYRFAMHLLIVNSGGSAASQLAMIYDHYDAANYSGILTGGGDGPTSANKLITQALQDGDAQTLSLFATPYGRACEEVFEQLRNAVIT